MKFAICDDDIHSTNAIISLLSKYQTLHPSLTISISTFSCGEELLRDISIYGEYDLYLLDIVMPGMNGIALGNELRRLGSDHPIIYLTSSEEYAIESYRVRALDYLLKPVKQEFLFSTLDNVMEHFLHKKEKMTVIKTKEGSMRIFIKRIMYAQLSNRIISYHLNDGSVLKSLYLRTSFTETIASLLDERGFVLCGAGMAVNLRLITKMENNTILFCNQFLVPVGTKAFRTLKSQWVDYCINEEEFR